eukprot:TRINITY_DN25449_c0_g1_i1.p1 TRINITY_DN25449_c0_g1~~TRINITY_DN25449_c0_g1_i1.p1  ORF type:complete len:259 (+),score=10.60 TRINITY_DN25449_c0_g1_i1:36-812(+)
MTTPTQQSTEIGQCDILSKMIVSKEVAYPATQKPLVGLLMCGDSRVTAEFLGQKFNSFPIPNSNKVDTHFILRNIGNQVQTQIGSILYPLLHIDSIQVFVVLGHTRCGAIKAAYEFVKNPSYSAVMESDIKAELGPLTVEISRYLTEIDESKVTKEDHLLDCITELNVNRQVDLLINHPDVQKKSKALIVGAVFDLSSKEPLRFVNCHGVHVSNTITVDNVKQEFQLKGLGSPQILDQVQTYLKGVLLPNKENVKSNL